MMMMMAKPTVYHWRAIPAETPVGFLQLTCSTIHRSASAPSADGHSCFRRQLREQSSITRDICTTSAPSLAIFSSVLRIFFVFNILS